MKRLSKVSLAAPDFVCVNVCWLSDCCTQRSGDESSSEEQQIALLSLQPPAVFLDFPGEPKIPFATWKKLFNKYLLAIVGNEFFAKRKKALLIHCFGTEGHWIYSTLPLATDDYDGSEKALEKYFNPKLNVVGERQCFRQQAQAVGESTDHYLAVLREPVKQCCPWNKVWRYGEWKTTGSNCRERLLMEEDLTLDRALEKNRRNKAAIADAKSMAVSDAKPLASIQVQKNVRRPKLKTTHKPNEATTCYCFGSADYKTNDKRLLKTVNVIHGKVGHFSIVWKSLQKSVNEVNVPEMCVLTVENGFTDATKLMCPVTITVPNTAHVCSVKLLVDTGSGVSRHYIIYLLGNF